MTISATASLDATSSSRASTASRSQRPEDDARTGSPCVLASAEGFDVTTYGVPPALGRKHATASRPNFGANFACGGQQRCNLNRFSNAEHQASSARAGRDRFLPCPHLLTSRRHLLPSRRHLPPGGAQDHGGFARCESPPAEKPLGFVPIALRRHSLCSLGAAARTEPQPIHDAALGTVPATDAFNTNHNDRPARSIGSARSYGGTFDGSDRLATRHVLSRSGQHGTVRGLRDGLRSDLRSP